MGPMIRVPRQTGKAPFERSEASDQLARFEGSVATSDVDLLEDAGVCSREIASFVA